MQFIKPKLFKGTRDLLPETLITREHVIDTMKLVFERHGFEPLETPAMEYLEVLTGKYGDEPEEQIYKLAYRNSSTLGLRFDLTVPLARVVAMHPEIPKPWKRYQIQPVWRGDKPQIGKGRFREFYHCDIDIVGSSDMVADAETIVIIYEVLCKLGLDDFIIQLNNRKILNGIAEWAQIPDSMKFNLYRGIDKFERDGLEGVEQYLLGKGVEQTSVHKVLEAISWRGESAAVFQEVRAKLASSSQAIEGADELEEIISYAEYMGVPSSHYIINLSLARGLDYYTGPISETTIRGLEIGSVTGGGRYDELIGLYKGSDAGRNIPTTGISFGLERIIATIEQLGLGSRLKTKTEVFMLRFNEVLKEELLFLTQLRQAGIKADFALAELGGLREQLGYAAKKGFLVVVIFGPDELARGEVVVRNMTTKTQRSIQRVCALDYIKGQLQ